MNPKSWTKPTSITMGKHHDISIKLKVIRLYKRGVRTKVIEREFGVDDSTIKRWNNIYEAVGKKGLCGHYHCISDEEKVRLVQDFLKKHISCEQYALETGIGRSTICRWVKIVKTEGFDALRSARKVSENETRAETKDTGTAKDKGAGERAQLSESRKRLIKKNGGLSKRTKSQRKEVTEAIDSLRPSHPLKDLLSATNMARSTYYYRHKRLSQDRYQHLKNEVSRVFEESMSTYGYRRITMALKAQGMDVNHKLVLKVMRLQNLMPARQKKRYKSYKGEVGKVAPNRINRDFKSNSPDHKWTTDISQVNINGDKIYISPIIDMYNAEVVSYTIGPSPNLALVTNMLVKALKARCIQKGDLIMHSDQGWHYQHESYCNILKDNGILQSMSRKGNCLDNSPAESFFGVMKRELLYPRHYKSAKDFVKAFHKYVDYYNNNRIKLRLGISPVKYRLMNSNKD